MRIFGSIQLKSESILSIIPIITQPISAIMPMWTLVEWAKNITFFGITKFTLVIYEVELLGIPYYFGMNEYFTMNHELRYTMTNVY